MPNNNFKNMIYDLEFKFVFSHEEILKDFINSYFKYLKVKKEFGFTKIVPQSYIMPDKKDVKSFFGDLVATLANGEIVLLEAYTSFEQESYIKSYNYMSRLYSNQLKVNGSYKDVKKVICINLMSGNFKNKNKELVNKYTSPKNDETFEVIDNGETELVLVRFDLVKKICYDECEARFIRWLRIMNAKSVEEMKKYSGGDEIMEQSIKYLEWYQNSELNTTFDDILKEREYKGEKVGRKEEKLETAKNMLLKGYPVKEIIEIIGLPEKEINRLKVEISK